jgi:hypothetical protein
MSIRLAILLIIKYLSLIISNIVSLLSKHSETHQIFRQCLCQTRNRIETTLSTRQGVLKSSFDVFIIYFCVIRLRKVVYLCKFDVIEECFNSIVGLTQTMAKK